MLLFSFFGIIDSFTNLKIMGISSMISILYISWAIGQFFDKQKYLNYVKAFFTYFLGFLTFAIGVLSIGYLIDSL